MNSTVRATCPKCRTALRIPTQWIGHAVRCKMCSTVVRSTPKRDDDTPRPAALDQTVPTNGFDFSQPPAGFDPLPLPAEPLPLDNASPPIAYPQAQPLSANPYAVPLQNELEANSTSAPPKTGRRYRRGNGKRKIVWIAVCFVMTAGLVVGGIFAAKYLNEQFGQQNPTTDPAKLVEQLAPPNSGGQNPVAKSGPFPRRMLFVSISKYMYLNPLTASLSGVDHSKPSAGHLAYQWRVPNEKDNNQLFILSDTAKPDPPIPMKNVVVGTYERFFETSRVQDRIVVYFGGHAVEKDGKAYLAPIEGELEDANTLIPLAEFYAKLNACKANQKVVIWDVCRFNPVRGHERPGSAPMTESLAKSLAAAPAGVEIIVTCQPGENALEFERLAITPPFAGSAFLGALKSLRPQAGAKAPTQVDPIPVAEWTQAVGKRVTELTALGNSGTKQTVKADGQPRADHIAYNPDEPPAKPFDMPVAPKGISSLEITLVAREFGVPPIKSELSDANLSELPFLESVMKDYRADVPIEDVLKEREKYRFRAVVLDAFQSIRDVWATELAGGDGRLKEEIPAPITDAVKREINKGLESYAIGIAKLELSNLALDEIESLKQGETKRWQAHYEYARAVVKARLAYLNEFNKLMGDVRTETLPALENGQNLYKLASSNKLKSKKDVQMLVEQAQEAYSKLITEHKGTPWAIQAKREKNFSLGLVWQPTRAVAPESK